MGARVPVPFPPPPIGDFLHRTFEHRPNQTLDIYVYNTTTYDEGTHLGRHIALNPLPFLTIKTT